MMSLKRVKDRQQIEDGLSVYCQPYFPLSYLSIHPKRQERI